MKQVEHTISYQVFENEHELESNDQDLLHQAREALKSAYSPYSGFSVGAAVLLENGKIITGNNQENVAYPDGLCAERVALFYANANYPDTGVKAIAISAQAQNFEVDKAVTPCGSCRQVIAETENRYKQKIRIILQGSKGEVIVMNGINNLLPLMFQAEKLKK